MANSSIAVDLELGESPLCAWQDERRSSEEAQIPQGQHSRSGPEAATAASLPIGQPDTKADAATAKVHPTFRYIYIHIEIAWVVTNKGLPSEHLFASGMQLSRNCRAIKQECKQARHTPLSSGLALAPVCGPVMGLRRLSHQFGLCCLIRHVCCDRIAPISP